MNNEWLKRLAARELIFFVCLDINGVHDLVGMISHSELSSEESYEYESVEDGEDIVLIVDVLIELHVT